MARLAGFNGTVEVYGYGNGPREASYQQRNYFQGRTIERPILGTYYNNKIRVWTAAPCSIPWSGRLDPLFVYGHELGHYIAEQRGKATSDEAEERRADAYGEWLIRRAAAVKSGRILYTKI